MSEAPRSDRAARSKYLSYLLRHKPQAAGLTLDSEGWCSVSALLANTDFTSEELQEIVETDAKGRYSYSFTLESGRLIRANQGHSTTTVKITFKEQVPPVKLYHGTVKSAQDVILSEGLKPMNRHHVHLTHDLNTALAVGDRRRSDTVVFEVDTKSMLADGHKFFISENGVWLAERVPSKYCELKLAFQRKINVKVSRRSA